MLDLHFPRHQQGAYLHVGRGLILPHLRNRVRPLLFEVGSEREQEILVERSTRSLQGPAKGFQSRCRAGSSHHTNDTPEKQRLTARKAGMGRLAGAPAKMAA